MAGELAQHPRELPYALRWLHSMLPGHSPLFDEVPWITFRAMDWLRTYLQPTMSVFEYGAGGSTLYFAKRVHEVVSVEHDEGFHELVSSLLSTKGIKNCQLQLCIPKPCMDGHLEFASYQSKYKGLCFTSYVKAIDPYPEHSFDLVLIDGRARMACLRRVIRKVKPGGAIMLDNSDRPDYAEANAILSSWPRSDFAGVTPWNMEVSQTTIWRMPH